MQNLLQEEISKRGHHGIIVPIDILEDIKQELNMLPEKEKLNNCQLELVQGGFCLETPKIGFEVKSIILVAAPSAKARMNLIYKGRRICLTIPPTYYDYSTMPFIVERYLSEFLSPYQLHVKIANELPRKLLATKSGLAKYGRNNISYISGIGSYVNLIPLFTDMESSHKDTYNIKRMEGCESCRLCLEQCPTGAIKEDKLMINCDRCLTYLNEADEEAGFPDWVSPKAHNSVIGCMVCQEVCPYNNSRNECVVTEDFSEEETKLLLSGSREEELPGGLIQKLKNLNMLYYLFALPRNMKALLDKEGILL